MLQQKVISVISMEMLWNQPLYKTITDIWDTFLRQATWWTVTSLADAMEMDEKFFFHHLDLSVLMLHSHLFLWLKINSLKFQVYLGQGPNTRGGGASTTDHPIRQTNYFHWSTDKTWHSTQWTLALRRKMSSVPHVFHKKWRNVDKT
jgi:hypothetical protein